MARLNRLRVICCLCCIQLLGVPVCSQNMDIDLLRAINPQDPNTGFWKATTNSYMVVAGAASLGTLAYGIIENDKSIRHKSYEIIIALGINIVTTDALKVVFNRKRPSDEYPTEVFALTTSNSHSFPSGHTSLAFATATSLTLTYKKWYVVVPAYLWAGCVGYSRMYLGKHYPSDVLGGAVVGAGSAVFSHWLSKKLFEQKPIKPVESKAL